MRQVWLPATWDTPFIVASEPLSCIAWSISELSASFGQVGIFFLGMVSIVASTRILVRVLDAASMLAG